MNEDYYYLAIDAGTTRFKVAALSKEGKILSKSDFSYRINDMLYHEYERRDFTEALNSTLETIFKKLDKRKIIALGVTGHGPTLIPISKEGNPLSTAIGYLDERVKKYVIKLIEKNTDRITSTMYIPIALFFKEEYPEVYQNTYRFLQSFDYIAYLLTENFTASSSSSGIKPWDKESIDKAGLDIKKFPPIFYMGSRLGFVSEKGEKNYGIPKGTPVFAIGVDFASALVGTNSLEKGRSCERAGTSGGINLCWDRRVDDNRLLCYKHFVPDCWNIAGITSTSGASIDWIKKVFNLKGFPQFKKKEKPKDIIFFPYLKGERTPLWNPYAKGIFFGLTKEHGKRDIILSVFLGVALSIRDCMEVIEENGCSFNFPVVTTGGQARNEWFIQLKSDVTGKSFVKVQLEDAELLGIAIVLLVATGSYPDLQTAAGEIVRIKKVYNPDKSIYHRYSKLYRLYKDIRSKLSIHFRDLHL